MKKYIQNNLKKCSSIYFYTNFLYYGKSNLKYKNFIILQILNLFINKIEKTNKIARNENIKNML